MTNIKNNNVVKTVTSHSQRSGITSCFVFDLSKIQMTSLFEKLRFFKGFKSSKSQTLIFKCVNSYN